MSERTGINWVQVTAAALAAVSSAVLLSTLGVAGTLVGAAMGSVIASVASNVYGRGLDLSKRQVAAQAAALRRVTAARADLDAASAAAYAGDPSARSKIGSAEEELDHAERALHEAEAPEEAKDATQSGTRDPQPVDEPTRRLPSLGSLPWKRIAVLAAVVFVGVMGVITAFEMVTGRAVSAYTGGSNPDTRSTVSGVAGDSGKPKPSKTPTETPTETATTQSSEPTETTESASPTQEPTVEATESATTEPTPTESAAPTDALSETPVLTPTPPPSPSDAAPTQ